MTMVVPANAQYFTYLCKCMSFKHHGNLTHYTPRTTLPFTEAELVQLRTPNDVVKYMCFATYNTATPGP